jgi:hypothetical protein
MILDMPLNSVGRGYAEKLFLDSFESLQKSQGLELVKVSQDFAARNMTKSGAYFTAQVEVLVRNAELLTQARVDSLVRAYEKSGNTLDGTALQEITSEAQQYCEQRGRNIVQSLQNQIGQTFGPQVPSGFSEAIAAQVTSQVSGISARVSRRLSIMRDEAVFRAGTAAASQSAASPNKSTDSADPKQSEKGSPRSSMTSPSQAAPSRPHLYYWKLCEKFGEECYRTWRAELLATFLISVVTYFISKGDDPFAWRNFEVALISTALTLAAFAVWHLLRTPWLVHRQTIADEKSAAHWGFGILGIAVLAGLVGGAYLSISYLQAKPAPMIMKISAPPPPSIQAQVQTQEKHERQNPVAPTVQSGHLDRVLNEQQSDHLYQKLKDIAADPRYSDLASVIIAPYAYQDRESAHLAGQLARIFEDAHWKVLREAQLPVKLEGTAQYQIPIGIWVLTNKDASLGYPVWSNLKEVGLDSEVRPKSDVPPDFKDLVIWVGYKEAPIY